MIYLIKVAVCDDDNASIHKIIDCLKAYDLIFLDIEMGELNGIDTAEKIRQIDTRVEIVYVTNYSSYLSRII